MSEHLLTLVARGRAQFSEEIEADEVDVSVSDTRELTGELEFDADRLYNGDVATTHRHGVVISTRDAADVVCDAAGAFPLDADEWDLTLRASLDDWQKVALKAAERRRTSDTAAVETAIDVLLSVHELAPSDRPILAALNIDETYGAGRRDELLGVLVAGPDVDDLVGDGEVSADV